MTDERFIEMATRSLLRDLEGAEAAEYEAELTQRGPRGATEVRELGEALGGLALAVPPVAPPAELWGRIETAIGAEGPTEADEAQAEPRVFSVTPPRASRAPGGRPVWPWAAAVAIAAALALWLGVAKTRLEDENERLRANVADAEAELAAADTAHQRLAEAREDLRVVAGPASSVHALTGSGALPDARARVFVDPATGRAILFAYDLPILAPGTVYELWAIADGTPQAAGVFQPGPDGVARLEIADASLLEDVDALAVTVEPAPGSEQPTSEPILLSS